MRRLLAMGSRVDTLVVMSDWPSPVPVTPLTLAASKPSVAIARLLLEHGASLEPQEGREGTCLQSPLGVAIEHRNPEMAALLLQHGANANNDTVMSVGRRRCSHEIL